MADTPRDIRAPELLQALQRMGAEVTAARTEIRTLADRSLIQPTRSAATGVGGSALTGAGDQAAQVRRVTEGLNEEAAARERNVRLQIEQLRLETEQGALAGRRAYTPATAGAQGGFPGTSATGPLLGVRPPPVAPEPLGVRPPGFGGAAAIGEESVAMSELRRQHVAYQQSTATSSVLTGEFVARLITGRASLAEFGNQLGVAAGKYASFTAAAAGVGIVFGSLHELYKGAVDGASGVEQLKRSLDNVDPAKAQAAFRGLSNELNVPIKEASDAVFQFSRTFRTLDEAVAAARVSLSALKVDNVQLNDSTRALTALHQQFGLGAKDLAGYFDILDEGQRRYNARVNDSIQLTQKATAAYKTAGGTAEGLARFAIYSERVTQLPGNQIGTALYRAASNTLRNPSNQAQIASLGLDPKLASTNIDEFLRQAITIAAGKGPEFQQQLAIAIGGKQQGGKVFLPILASGDLKLFNEIQGITTQSAAGSTARELGDILKRPDEVLKSIGNQLQNLGSHLADSHFADILGLALLTLKQILVTANDLAGAFNSIPDPFRQIGVDIGVAYGALLLLRKAGVGGALNFLPGATTGERGAKKDALGVLDSNIAATQAARGSLIGKQVELRSYAEINRLEAQIVTTEAERAALLQGAIDAEANAALAARRQVVIEGEIGKLMAERVGIMNGQIKVSETLAAQNLRLNEVSAVGGAAAAGAGRTGFLAGVPEAVSKEGIAAGIKGALGGALTAGLVASIALPFIQSVLPKGQVTDFLGKNTGGLTGIAAAAGAGASVGGPFGAAAGGAAAGAVFFGKAIGEALAGNATDPGQGSAASQGKLFDSLLKHTELLAQGAKGGHEDTQGIQSLHDRLVALAKDPNYANLKTNLDGLTAILTKLGKTAGLTFEDFTTATKHAQQLADKAKVATTIGGVESEYGKAVTVLEKSHISSKEQGKGITNAQKELAIQQQKQAELGGVSAILDADTGLANAQTQDKSAQLRNTLAADTQKLALALKLFGKNSIEYKKALATSLQEQQAIAQQGIADIASRGALATSQIGGVGPEADIARAQSSITSLQAQLSAARASGADPNTIRGLQTSINDANRALGQSVNAQAKNIRDTAFALREANSLNPVKTASLELQNATQDLQGLTGLQRDQQLVTIAQKRAALTQAQVTEELSQLSYEKHIHQISDNSYIASLQDILRTKRLSTDQRRQLLTQIYDLQHAAANSSSGLNLNVGQIKLPTIYEIRRAIAGGQQAQAGGSQTVVNNSPTVNVTVAHQSDVAHVVAAIDKTLGTTARSAARSLGIL